MKVVVLTGPESSGKSWLATILSERFGGVRVDEYVREYCEAHGTDTSLADVELIAREQCVAKTRRGPVHRPCCCWIPIC